MAMSVIGMIMATEEVDQATATTMGEVFTAYHNASISNYLRVGSQQISTDITDDDVHTWLSNPIGEDVTIRDSILAQIAPIVP